MFEISIMVCWWAQKNLFFLSGGRVANDGTWLLAGNWGSNEAYNSGSRRIDTFSALFLSFLYATQVVEFGGQDRRKQCDINPDSPILKGKFDTEQQCLQTYCDCDVVLCLNLEIWNIDDRIIRD